MSLLASFSLFTVAQNIWSLFFVAGLISDARDIVVTITIVFVASSLGLLFSSLLLTAVLPRLNGRKRSAIAPYILVEPLLLTKLRVPPIQANGMSRIHLADYATKHRIVFLSAPAGSGKTTLLSEWIHQNQYPTAYIRLDDGDNSPKRLLAYIIAALQTIRPNAGGMALTSLQSATPPSIESIMTLLMNDLGRISEQLGLAFDDYQHIHAPAAHDIVAHLVEQAPPSMHFFIASRGTPPLPLSRWRVSGEMVELRAADLRFTSAETTAFLNRVMGLDLSREQAASLHHRTEGWIAGLRLIALALHNSPDAGNIVGILNSCHPFVACYLDEEVFVLQPMAVQRFLFQTSILDRLCAPLCDTVTGQTDGETLLEAFQQGNLFIIPIGDSGWYRYHRLFADFLRDKLRRSYGDEVRHLHRLAAQWYEQNDMVQAAIKHALAAADFAWATRLSALDTAPTLPTAVCDAKSVCVPPTTTETLSERELEVLRLLILGLSNQEIAQNLTVTLNTVKTHVRSIYGKLEVRSRVQATLRARELHLLQ